MIASTGGTSHRLPASRDQEITSDALSFEGSAIVYSMSLYPNYPNGVLRKLLVTSLLLSLGWKPRISLLDGV